jgi:hypothetical protein
MRQSPLVHRGSGLWPSSMPGSPSGRAKRSSPGRTSRDGPDSSRPPRAGRRVAENREATDQIERDIREDLEQLLPASDVLAVVPHEGALRRVRDHGVAAVRKSLEAHRKTSEGCRVPHIWVSPTRRVCITLIT